jgi:hypothetical protein
MSALSSEDVADVPRIYLDQNKWLDLSRAHHGDTLGAPFKDALKAATTAVEAGSARFPLSAGHYFETWKHRESEKRRALGAVMAAVSRCETIGDQRTITVAEIDTALSSAFGLPAEPRPATVFGFGAAHAFGEPQLADYRRIAATDPRYAGMDEALADLFERETLSGPPANLPADDIAQPDLSAAQAYASGENELAAAFAEHKTPREEQERTIAFQELTDLLPLIVPALARAGIPVEEFLALGADAITELMLSMPWRGSVFALRQRRHREAHQAWKPNDLQDVSYLSLGLAYCDILVAEKQWVSRIKAAKLDERCGTVVLADLRELAGLL